MIFWAAIIIILGALAYIRFAPVQAEKWHVDPKVVADQDLFGGVRRRVSAADIPLEALHAKILETPRTDVVAGTLDSGHLTYVTRSKVMGFPDYTTVKKGEEAIEIYGRLRFGSGDMGVNKARVDGWLKALRAQ